jgi:hypothetical protein
VTELAQTHLQELFKQLTPGSAYQKGGVPAGSR